MKYFVIISHYNDKEFSGEKKSLDIDEVITRLKFYVHHSFPVFIFFTPKVISKNTAEIFASHLGIPMERQRRFETFSALEKEKMDVCILVTHDMIHGYIHSISEFFKNENMETKLFVQWQERDLRKGDLWLMKINNTPL